jgi:hypothetical protein
MLLVLRPGRGVRVGDVNGGEDPALERVGLIAFRLTGLAEQLVGPVEDVEVEVGDPHVGVAPLGHELDRLEGPHAGDPHLGVGLLDGSGPGIHVADAVVLATELEGPGLRPRRHDQVMRLDEALPGFGRIDGEGVVLRPPADHEPGDETSAGDHVDHGELLRHPGGRVVEGEGVAHHGDLHPGGLAGQDGGDEIR